MTNNATLQDNAQRCGAVAVIGAPNAGKSTLVNALVGQKVAITSAKAQTTRTRMTGIALFGNSQVLLLDTPGIFKGNDRFDRSMVSAASDSLEGADLVMIIRDASRKTEKHSEMIAQLAARSDCPVILILNKVDQTPKPQLLDLANALQTELEPAQIFFTNSLTGEGLDPLRDYLRDNMPLSEWHYPEDQVSDVSQRLFAAEVTREQLYHRLHSELPYASAIRTEKYEERKDGSLEIHQQILVERPTQRAIILGKGGSMIKEIGAAARTQLAEQLGGKVHLYLHVRVEENWRDSADIYREIGLEQR